MFYRSTIFLFSVLIISCIIGCETNKDLTLDIEKEYLINNKTTTTAQDSVIIPSSTNSDFEKYKFDIQSVSLLKSSFTITSFQTVAGKKPDSIIVDSIAIKVGDIFGNTQTDLTTFRKLRLNVMVSQPPMMNMESSGQYKFENLISNPPFGARLYLKYSNSLDSTLYKVKLNFSFKVTYKEKTPFEISNE